MKKQRKRKNKKNKKDKIQVSKIIQIKQDKYKDSNKAVNKNSFNKTKMTKKQQVEWLISQIELDSLKFYSASNLYLFIYIRIQYYIANCHNCL